MGESAEEVFTSGQSVHELNDSLWTYSGTGEIQLCETRGKEVVATGQQLNAFKTIKKNYETD